MRNEDLVYLMYHELEVAGRPLCHKDPGYVRYVVREPDFRRQMQWLRDASIRGISISEALGEKMARGIAVTFDDGCETDLLVAAPILQEFAFNATFYITTGFLGRSGYLVASQLRQLSEAGFEIGCHSMTHPCLSDLSELDLDREIADAKTELEQLIGRRVKHFSCPGGRWSSQVSAVARRAGYGSVATSRISVNRPGSDPFALSRITVMRGLPPIAFQNICRGRQLWQLQLRSTLQTFAHTFLGHSLYDRMRQVLLERKG
jgi:peptidoglycan/xylan/chitin deacetylase (PgdA/CDA1 family)